MLKVQMGGGKKKGSRPITCFWLPPLHTLKQRRRFHPGGGKNFPSQTPLWWQNIVTKPANTVTVSGRAKGFKTGGPIHLRRQRGKCKTTTLPQVVPYKGKGYKKRTEGKKIPNWIQFFSPTLCGGVPQSTKNGPHGKKKTGAPIPSVHVRGIGTNKVPGPGPSRQKKKISPCGKGHKKYGGGTKRRPTHVQTTGGTYPVWSL